VGIGHEEFRQVLRRWVSGVTILTTRHRGGVHGMTANSFSSVSLDPPLVLVCVDRRNRTHEYLQGEGVFGIHILSEGQQELSERCAGRRGEGGNQLHDVAHHEGAAGAPILEDCLASLECRLLHTYEGGDHTIFVGEVVSSHVHEDRRPLVYSNGAYRRLDES
jgi:flavin reductase (DIM6/NTAB) family NADH-FMN oxidoreductase RutF